MNKLITACFASILATTVVQASSPCDSFEVKIQNATPDNFLMTSIKLDGADLQPGGIQRLGHNSEQVFTVNNSTAKKLAGELVLHSESLPSKEVKIQFKLQNKGLVCEHTDKSPKSEYALDTTRTPGKIQYTIG